jgi:hypothetical protein
VPFLPKRRIKGPRCLEIGISIGALYLCICVSEAFCANGSMHGTTGCAAAGLDDSCAQEMSPQLDRSDPLSVSSGFRADKMDA